MHQKFYSLIAYLASRSPSNWRRCTCPWELHVNNMLLLKNELKRKSSRLHKCVWFWIFWRIIKKKHTSRHRSSAMGCDYLTCYIHRSVNLLGITRWHEWFYSWRIVDVLYPTRPMFLGERAFSTLQAKLSGRIHRPEHTNHRQKTSKRISLQRINISASWSKCKWSILALDSLDWPQACRNWARCSFLFMQLELYWCEMHCRRWKITEYKLQRKAEFKTRKMYRKEFMNV